jgi:hypothetical protein
MIFDSGNNNLRDIHSFMTKVDNLMSEIAGIRAGRKRLLTLNIIRLFNESKSQSKKAPQNLKQNPIRV